MNSAIDNGGATHVKYAHVHFPRVLALICPKCEGKAIATNRDAPEEVLHFIDIAGFEKLWNIKCLNCDFRSTAGWEGTKKLDLLLKAEVRGIKFWAWNQGHLKMILKRLQNENWEADKWAAFATYIPGEWLSKLNGPREIRKIEKLLERFEE